MLQILFLYKGHTSSPTARLPLSLMVDVPAASYSLQFHFFVHSTSYVPLQSPFQEKGVQFLRYIYRHPCHAQCTRLGRGEK
jgi:hypothetical protein